MEQVARISAQALRYVMTGGTAAFIDAGGFYLLHRAGLATAAAAALSFCVAAAVNYSLTSRFVFHTALSSRRLLLFFLFALVGLIVNVALTMLFIIAADMPPLVAKVVAIGFAFAINFALNAGIVFRQRISPSRPPSWPGAFSRGKKRH